MVSPSIIHASSTDERFILIVVYGYNERSNRRDLDRELRYQNQLYGNQTWLIMRGFNIILDGHGKTGRKMVDRNVIKEFIDWIEDIDMVNITLKKI